MKRNLWKAVICLFLCANLLGTSLISYADENDEALLFSSVEASSSESSEEASIESSSESTEEASLESSDESSLEKSVEAVSEESSEVDSSTEGSSFSEAGLENSNTILNYNVVELDSAALLSRISEAMEQATEGETVEISEPIDGTDLIDTVTIEKENATLTSGSSVKLSDSFKIIYVLKNGIMLNSENSGVMSLKSGNTYTFPDFSKNMPFADYDRTIDVNVIIDGNSITLGTVTISDDGQVSLEVGQITEEEVTLSDISFGISCRLDQEKIGDNSEVEFTLPCSESTIKIVIADNLPKAPTVSKEGTPSSDGLSIDWTVKITNDGKPIQYEDGYTLKDVFKDQKFKDNSFEIISGEGLSSDALVISDDKESFTYKIDKDIANKENGIIEIKYSTEPQFFNSLIQNNAGGSKDYQYSNTASLFDEDVAIEGATATETVAITKTISQWVAKEGGAIIAATENGTFTNAKAHWKIAVNTNGFSLKEFTVYDELVTDDSTIFEIISNSIKVRNNGNDTEMTFTPSVTNNDGMRTISWNLNLGNVSGDNIYVIEYDAELKDYNEFLRTNHIVEPKNKAWFTYKLNDGPELLKSPEVGITSEITKNAAIEKTAVGYDKSTHEIKWKIEANKTKQPLTNARIEDEVDDNQEFVKFEGGEDYYIASGNVADFRQDGLNGKSVIFYAYTKLKDSKSNIWGINGTTENVVKNTAVLYSDQQAEGIKYSAFARIESKVIDKKVVSYDHQNHYFNYEINVDHNNMPMSDVVIKDVYDNAMLELVRESVKLDDSSFDNFVNNNGEITFTLGNIESQRKLTYSLKIKDSYIDALTGNKSRIKAHNSATLYYAGFYNENGLTVNADKEVGTSIILKNGQRGTENEVTYKVQINAAQKELPDDLTVQDTLGASLKLNENSIKLYFGDVNSAGEVVADNSREITDYKKSITKKNGKTVLNISLPNSENKRRSYVLEYKARAVYLDANDFNNSIELIQKNSESSYSDTVQYTKSSFSSGFGSSLPKLTIKVLDEDDKITPIKDATYVIKDSDGNTVSTLTTNKNGTDFSVGELELDTKYTVEETSVPISYDSNPENKVEFILTASNKKQEYIFYNTSKKNTFYVRNESVGQGERLIGSKFSITTGGKNKELEKWTTIDEDHLVNLPTGEYVLTQKEVPTGYIKANPISFVIDIVNDNEGFKLTVKNLDPKQNELVSYDEDTHTLIVKNDVDYNVSKTIELININKEDEKLNGAKVTISSGEKDGIQCVTATDVAPNDEDNGKINVTYQTVYKAVQDEAPEGYEAATPVIFKLSNTGEILYKNEEDGSFYPDDKLSKKYPGDNVVIVNDKTTKTKQEVTEEPSPEIKKPEDKPKTEETVKKPEEKPKTEETVKKPEEKPKTEETVKKPEEKLNTEEPVKKPEEKPKTEETVKKPEEKPKTEEIVKKPEEKPKTEETVKKPEEKPKTEETVKKPEEKLNTEEPVKKPEEKPKTEETVKKPEEKPKTEETVKKPEEKPKTEETVKKPEEKPNTEETVKKPEEKPKTEENVNKPEKKTEDSPKEELKPEPNNEDKPTYEPGKEISIFEPINKPEENNSGDSNDEDEPNNDDNETSIFSPINVSDKSTLTEISIETTETMNAENDADNNTPDGGVHGSNRLAKTGGFIGTVFAYGFGFVLFISGLCMIFGKKKNEKK